MQKNKRRALTLIALLAITVLSSFWVNRRSVDIVDPDLFRFDDLSIVDSVELEVAGRKNILRFDGTRWMLNNQYRADGQMIEVLFATLEQIVPRRPVSANMRDSVAQLLKDSGTRVTLFAGKDKKGEFWAGGNERKSEAWFLSADNEPYVMAIPGYRVYASGVFELDENGWRDKQVFRFNQRNFRSLALNYTKEPASNFVINYKDQVFDIPGLPDADTTKIFDYLDAVALLKAERLLRHGEMAWIDSLMVQEPSFTVDVTDISGRTSHVKIYPPAPRRPQVVGAIGEEAALFRRTDIIKLAKKKTYFSLDK